MIVRILREKGQKSDTSRGMKVRFSQPRVGFRVSAGVWHPHKSGLEGCKNETGSALFTPELPRAGKKSFYVKPACMHKNEVVYQNYNIHKPGGTTKTIHVLS